MSTSIRRLAGFVFFLLLTWGASAASFVPPSDSPPPFRRDLLPIDTDSMVHLSRQLTLLAHTLPPDTAENRRAAAQTLAIALALDPVNASARETLQALEEGKARPKPEPDAVAKAKARLWQIRGWLATEQAGEHGNNLATLLGDCARALDPGHPVAVALKSGPEAGKWDGWVAPLGAFADKAVADTDPFEGIEPDMKAEPENKESAGIRLASAKLSTVLASYHADGDTWLFQPVTVTMNASREAAALELPEAPQPTLPPGMTRQQLNRQQRLNREEEPGLDPVREGFRIHIPSDVEDLPARQEEITAPVLGTLGKVHPALPDSGLIRILAGESGRYVASKNHGTITGPAFVLASAAITGVEPEAVVMAQLTREDHELELPDYFWTQLAALKNSPGGRLVVPAHAEEYITAFLALEMPEFLLSHEVLLASSPAELLALTAKTPEPAIAAALAKFAEIRDKSKGTPTGTYLANRFVRQRLAELSQEAPYHLSAKLLAIQGAGERPTVLSRKLLAAEIWRCVDPIHGLARIDLTNYDAETITLLDESYDRIRAEVDKLDRYTDIRDRDLQTRAKDLTTTIRALTRAMRARGELIDRFEGVITARTAMNDANTKFREELSQLTGDPLPEAPEEARLPRLRRRNLVR